VAGKVTFAGKPVPAGWITFTADTTKGNSGPQGVARIRSGTYSTAGKEGKGTVGGPMVVRIEGFDGQGTDASPDGRRLFAPYEVAIELPRGAATKDLEVPASAADKAIPVSPP
jgi:hypothetical protein